MKEFHFALSRVVAGLGAVAMSAITIGALVVAPALAETERPQVTVLAFARHAGGIAGDVLVRNAEAATQEVCFDLRDVAH